MGGADSRAVARRLAGSQALSHITC